MSEELEVIEEVEHHAPRLPATLFNTDDPAEVVVLATKVANALASVVKGQGLSTNIQGREHVRVEGWTLLGSMLGVFPVTVWTRPVLDADGHNNGWEARVEARTRDGSVVGAAEAECMRTEKTWKGRDSYALRSMAQTRATSKALRHPLGFVMTIAGFEATPEEEIPRDDDGKFPSVADQEARLTTLFDEYAERTEGFDKAAAVKMMESRRGTANYSEWLSRQIANLEGSEPASQDVAQG